MNDLAITQQQTKFKILLIGDSCVDEYKIGTVDRLSPEAPVPVIKISNQYNLPGMSRNVQTNLEKLGLYPDFITNQEQITKTRFIDQRSGQHLLRVDREPFITPWDRTTPIDIHLYDCVIISDYNKGFLSYADIQYIVHNTQCPIFIDSKKTDLLQFNSYLVYVKINEAEYKNRTSTPENLIITMGSAGAILKTSDGEKIFKTQEMDVVDVCGCGDTFLSALVYQYLMTQSIEDAIIFANKAAGVTVQHQGNYSPTLEEINGY